MTRPNGFETANRRRKASRLLGVLDVAAGGVIVGRELAKLDAADWRKAAAIAGCRPPSAETIALVTELVAERDAYARDVGEVLS